MSRSYTSKFNKLLAEFGQSRKKLEKDHLQTLVIAMIHCHKDIHNQGVVL